MIKFYKGDYLEILKKLKSGSVDLVLTDPPYGYTDANWDFKIDIKELWHELKRVGHDKTKYIIFGCEPFATKIRYANLKNYKYDYIWKKNNKTRFLSAKYMPLSNFEKIMVFYKKYNTYNPQGLKKCTIVCKGKEKSGSLYSGIKKGTYIRKRKNYPTDVLEFDVVHNLKKIHNSQKPLPLLKYLIKTHTKKGDLILDPFSGSGSTLKAADLCGHNAIGIDKHFNSKELMKEIKDAEAA